LDRKSRTALTIGRYEVLTDGNDLHYVETNFGPAGLNRPDIVYFYKSLTAKIIKADLLRYLILYNEGGVYADIDVEALQPVDNFIPPHFDKADVDLVISIEIDEPTYANHTILGPKSQSFCQWTIMSKPRSPAILRIINNVINWLTDVARKQDVHVSEIKLNFDDVLSGTGPSAFTIAIIDEMKAQTGRKTIDWVPMFHNMSEPKLVGRTLVLTVESFAAGQGHSNSGNHDSPKALVKHHYHASKWPDRHPRYSHPGYGMVEECNWNPDCVAAWDNNTALYPTLSEEEKAKVLEEKKKYDEERFHGEEEDRINREREDAERRDRDMREQCAKLDPPFAPLPPPEPQHNGGENHEGENHEEQKPAEDKPAEEKPKEDKPIEEKPPEEKPSEQKPEGEKPRDGKDVEPPHVAPIKPEKETKTNT
jgi:hypothetical protein